MSKVFLKWFILDLQPSLARDPLKSPQIPTVIKVLYCLFVVVLFTSMSHVVQVSASNLKRWASSLALCVRGGLKKSAAVGLYRNTHTHIHTQSGTDQTQRTGAVNSDATVPVKALHIKSPLNWSERNWSSRSAEPLCDSAWRQCCSII